jgi:hypothetical protein
MINDNGEDVEFAAGEDAPLDERELYQTIDVIAQLGWETHRTWEHIIGDPPRLPWDELSPAAQEEIKIGVKYIIEHPTVPVHAQHDHWRAAMAAAGHDHPNMVEWSELSYSQQMKARLWRHIVHAVIG